jgi:hypothetical protein
MKTRGGRRRGLRELLQRNCFVHVLYLYNNRLITITLTYAINHFVVRQHWVFWTQWLNNFIKFPTRNLKRLIVTRTNDKWVGFWIAATPQDRVHRVVTLCRTWAFINSLKPSGYYMYCTTSFNIQKFYILPTLLIYVFCMDLRTNSDYTPHSIKWLLFYIRRREGGGCLLCCTKLIFSFNWGWFWSLKGW